MPDTTIKKQTLIHNLGLWRFLSPWFTRETMAEAARDLEKNGIGHLLFYRTGVAAVLNGKKRARAMAIFEPAPAIDQRFRIVSPHCSLCKRQNAGDYCRHIAAMTLQTMTGHDSASFTPAALILPQSQLATLGRFLHGCHGHGRRLGITVTPRTGPEPWQVTIRETQGNTTIAAIALSDAELAELAALAPFFVGDTAALIDIAKDPDILTLFQGLQGACRSKTESMLNAASQQSQGQKQDGSIWPWLAAKTFQRCPEPAFVLTRKGKDGLFELEVGSGGEVLFTAVLPREKTIEYLRKFPGRPFPPLLPPARAFTRANLIAESGAVLLTPCLRLPEGGSVERHLLNANRFGSHYYIGDTGFFPVDEQQHDFGLVSAPEMTLLITDLARQHREITQTLIAAPDVPAFVQAQVPALRSDENEVDPALVNLELQNLPDRFKLQLVSIDDDWCHLAIIYGMGSAEVALHELLAARHAGATAYASGKKWLRLKDSPLDWLYGLGQDRLARDSDGRCVLKLSRREVVSLTALATTVGCETESAVFDARVARLLNPSTWQDSRTLPALPDHLREYQARGLAWLYQLQQLGLGGILADDMGLGKTHQMLGLFSILAGTGAKKFLVLCPTTVAPHWADKIRSFYPHLSCHIHHGAGRDLADLVPHAVIITTYGILRRDIDLLATIPFEVIVFDEMQNLKNKTTGAYKAARLLQGRTVFGLTGTPLENSVGDLKALFDLCLPGLLGGDEAFRRQYVVPIEGGHKELRDQLAARIAPFLLRRHRTQVLTELPEVIEDIRTCELSADQVRLYRDLVDDRGKVLLEKLETTTDGDLPYMEILAIINYLKQICDHPSLLDGSGTSDAYRSGKWDLFVELLDECLDSGLKIVVFSQYVTMLDIMERYLRQRQIAFVGIRGAMAMKARAKAIKEFNEGEPRVCTASLLAGGTGIDLTGAQVVIHYDRWWNAAREDQATARVHRMGQQKAVQVFKLVTVGTLEEKIHQLIDKRRGLAASLIQEDDAGVIKGLSRDDLLGLLRLDAAENPISC